MTEGRHDPGRHEVILLHQSGGETEQMARDVRRGFLAQPKDLSPWPKYFYGAEGSRLFEEITGLPEYYRPAGSLWS